MLGASPREVGACRTALALVAIHIGLEPGRLNRELFTMLVIMALLTTAMTEPLLRWWLPKDLRPENDIT